MQGMETRIFFKLSLLNLSFHPNQNQNIFQTFDDFLTILSLNIKMYGKMV